jgi:hypothetical protein
MKLKILIGVLFLFQINAFSQKIEKKNLVGEWTFIKGGFGEDNIELQKFSAIPIEKTLFETVLNFDNTGTFFTKIFTGEGCVDGMFCLPTGTWELKKDQIEFPIIKNGGNETNCRFRHKITYRIVEYSDSILLLKKIKANK